MNKIQDGIIDLKERKILINEKNIKILENVKEILTLGNTEFITVQMVADYFEVGLEAIKSLVKDNKEELEQNGLKTYSKKDFLKVLKEPLRNNEQLNGKSILTFADGYELIYPNRGLMMISKRVLLNIGMLLRDSEVAKELRRRILDIVYDVEENKGSIDTIINDIEIEKEFKIKLADTILNGDLEKENEIKSYIINLRNKRITELQIENNQLKEEIEELEEYKLLKNMLDNSNIEGLPLGELGIWLKSNTGLNIGRNKLFKWCKNNKLVRKSAYDGNNYAMDRAINNNWMKNQCKFIEYPNGNILVTNKIIVTKKGILYIGKKLFQEKILKNLK